MPIKRTEEEIEFLKRVDARWRDGDTQGEIAVSVGLNSAGALQSKMTRLGFQFSRRGGLKVVDVMLGRPFAEWLSSGELVADEPAEAAVA